MARTLILGSDHIINRMIATYQAYLGLYLGDIDGTLQVPKDENIMFGIRDGIREYPAFCVDSDESWDGDRFGRVETNTVGIETHEIFTVIYVYSEKRTVEDARKALGPYIRAARAIVIDHVHLGDRADQKRIAQASFDRQMIDIKENRENAFLGTAYLRFLVEIDESN